MILNDIFTYLQNPPPRFINPETAVSYILAVLLEKDSYGLELIHQMTQEHPNFRVSDSVLYNAIKFLESEGFVSSYQQKVQGRGRPRQMYCLNSEKREQAEEIAQLGNNYLSNTALPKVA